LAITTINVELGSAARTAYAFQGSVPSVIVYAVFEFISENGMNHRQGDPMRRAPVIALAFCVFAFLALHLRLSPPAQRGTTP